ncbi:MAG: hypothetical protein GTO54_07020, partial [Nitrososphaeria archaeon]|nr:hypothetical protein [Nitrososphaeria archaeon]
EIKDEFRGLPKYIFDDKRIRKFFAETKEKYILYGEWLIKHTVNYDPEFMNRFWIFDVYDKEEHRYLKYPEYEDMLVTEKLDYIPVILTITDPTMDILLRMVREKEHTPKSGFGADAIEGLVYKNYDFINRFGNNVYMKAVTKDFYEIHRTVMGGAGKRIDPEVYLIHKYQTPARMEKMYHKMVDDHGTLQMKHIPEFMNRVLHDLFVEDAWNMFMRDKSVKKLRFDMGTLRKVSYAMSKNWYIDKLRQRGTDGDDKEGKEEDKDSKGE